MWNIDIILMLLVLGSIAGFLAGLFGIGGGIITVPVILWVLQSQGLGKIAHAQHIAVGSSFAIMVFTTFASAFAQHRKKSLDWNILRHMAPGMIIGVLLGSYISKYIPNHGLQIFFVLFILFIAIKTLVNVKAKPKQKSSRGLPGWKGLAGVGGLFGVISSWLGAGGGTLSVPFMLYCNVPPVKSVGTSAGLSWCVAVSGAIGYLYTGWGIQGLPSGTFGFWYLPAVAILSVAAVVFAPVGVKVAHKLPPEKLKFAFGILLLIIAAKMGWGIIINLKSYL